MKRFLSAIVVLLMCVTLSPVGTIRAQSEPVLTLGSVNVPFVYRDGYYVASATVNNDVKSFSVNGGLLPSYEQEITATEARLLVVNYHDGAFHYKLLPIQSDGAVMSDVRLLRYPEGAVPANQAVTFYVYTPRRDVSKVVITLTDRGLSDEQAPSSGKPKSSQDIELKKVAESNDGFYDVWRYQFTPTTVTWYQYTAYAYDGSTKRKVDEGRLTVYDPSFKTPDWLKNAVIYQIFPDRFKDGNPDNNVTQEGQKFTFHDAYLNEDFTLPGDYMGQLIQGAQWSEPVTSWATVTMTDGTKKCGYVDSYRFYGGDLEGIIQELDYLQSLGVTAIYLNPIFPSESTHRYDPASYFAVDPRLGDPETYQKLTQEAAKRGIRIIDDITPDHSGDDSIYFDVKGAYTSTGAHESQDSPYYAWYNFTQWPDKWEGWGGFSAMPIINVLNKDVQKFFLTGDNNVMKYWNDLGSSGWRVDVAMQVPMGFTRAMRQTLKSLNPDNVMIAEVWDHYEQAIPMLLGDSFDSVMNYRIRSLLIGDWDNDHAGTNPQYQGFFLKKDMTQEDFWAKYMQMKNDYPKEAFYAMMNLVDSHDAARPMYYLSSTWQNSATSALKALSFFLYTIPGAPTTFYGDEAGATNGGSYGCNQDRPLTDDPFMRVPFPWGNEDTNLQAWYKNLGAIRNQYSFLRTGEIEPLQVQGSDRVVAYLRYDANGTALALFNGSDAPATVTVNPGYYVKNNATLKGVIGTDMKVENGLVTLTLQPFETRLGVTTDSISNAKVLDLQGTATGQTVSLSFTGSAVVEKRDLTTGEVTTLNAKDGLTDTARAGHSYVYTVSVLSEGLKVAQGIYAVDIEGNETVEPPITAQEQEETGTSTQTFTSIVIEDPTGDDNGPGYYTYPTDSVFKKGDFDLLKFELGLSSGIYTATYSVGNLDNAWGSTNGLSKATYFLFIDNKPNDGTTQGIQGLNVAFADNFKWDVGLQIEGWESKVYQVNSGEINAVNASDLGVEIKGTEGAPGRVVVTIPQSVLGALTPESKMMIMVAGQDGYGVNRIRQVTPEAQQWRFGGGNEAGTAPAVLDMFVPEGMKQSDLLDYKTHSVALPGIPLKPFFTTEGAERLTVLTPQDGTLLNTTTIDIKVKVTDTNLKQVVVGEQSFDVTQGENTLSGVQLPNEGENSIQIKDVAGTVLATVKLIRDTTPPQIEIISPKEGTLLTDRAFGVTAKTEPNAKVVLELFAPGGLTADAVSTNADAQGNVKVDVAFRAFQGLNIMKATVTDGAGNSSAVYTLFAYGRAQTAKLTIGSKSMDVNVDTVTLDAAPFIKDGNTMVPLRAIAEAFGGVVSWDESSKTAKISFAGHIISLSIGSKEAVVDGKTLSMSLPAEIVNGRTFVPARFIANAFGLTIKWDDKAKTITVTYP
ncbi:glucodextranase DOMON-like domain-containing protein [Coprothermobacter platensis]|uniref:glucodextranase DOMON-like domain-containing protein n=1 Tax=Coprothermobacter platensis TaxID=108819 RepID=UPI00037BC27A|nr:glucodextranase DOMON-like domain-containing protein [Coprothermobacter platensis]